MGILGRKRTQKASTLGPAPCRHCGKSSGCSCAKHPPRCRYCGKLSAYGWSQLVCVKCERKRSKIEIGAVSQYSIAERRGWTGPLTIGDDQLLLTLSRRMRDADHRRVEDDEKDARKAHRERKSRSWARSTGDGGKRQDKPQKSSVPGTEVRPDFAEAAE